MLLLALLNSIFIILGLELYKITGNIFLLITICINVLYWFLRDFIDNKIESYCINKLMKKY